MAVYNESDPRFGQDEPPTVGPMPALPTYPQYRYAYTDAQGVNVFRGDDGQLYRDDPNNIGGYTLYQPSKPTETPNAPPPSAPPPTGGGGSPGLTPGLTVPTPLFEPPGYTPPPAFSYADFIAPSGDELNSDPLYKYTLKTQQDAIQKSAAARGILNTGGTIYDLLRNANDIATSAYGSLFGRNLSTYETNRRNAVENYRMNVDNQFKDPYQYNYQGAQDSYNSRVHASDLANSYGWASRLFDWQKDSDIWNRKLGLLSYT